MRLYVHNGELCARLGNGKLELIEGVEIRGMRIIGPFPTKSPDVSMHLTLMSDKEDQTLVPMTPLDYLKQGFNDAGILFTEGQSEGHIYVFVRNESEPAELTTEEVDLKCRSESYFEFEADGQVASY